MVKSPVQSLVLYLLTSISPVSAAFGYTKSGNNIVVDAGSSNSLVFSVNTASCDINSIKYRGTELQYSSKGSHISSGLGTATVSAANVSGSSSSFVKVTCVTDTLTHYLVARQGDSNIYMATYITAEPSIGELRFIARLQPDQLPEEYPHGNASTTGGGSSVEGSDVFLVDGETRSKFYSSDRFMDEDTYCVSRSGTDPVNVCVLRPQKESSSGGPFFRDINSNNAGDSTNLYNYMNSGHVQTESFRTGLHGPYIFQFTRSGVPKLREIDVSFFGELGITGYVADADRGSVTGKASGVGTGFQAVVHWYNSDAQYWTTASSGSFTSPRMKPGNYTMVLYQTEFKVSSTDSVVVSAGKATTADITSTFNSDGRTTLWQIGKYDGQPTGFRNADKFLRMHPSDDRMDSWGPLTYTVGTSVDTDFPMAIFQDVNNPVTIKFSLDSDQGAATLRIATTLSFAGSRPQVKVNSWTGPAPGAPTNLNSRGVTRGAYRGNGNVYEVDIPSGTLVAGSNTITITSISGNSGSGFLSPNLVSCAT